MSQARNGTTHFSANSFAWDSVTWLHLTARGPGKCSLWQEGSLLSADSAQLTEGHTFSEGG